MKQKYSYAIALLLAASFTACNEEEVQTFSDKPGVNFLERYESSNNVSWGNGYTNLYKAIDYFDVYASGEYEKTEGEVPVRIQLEGRLSETPLKVKFKAQPVQDFGELEIMVPEESVEIKAGEYTVDAVIKYKKPSDYDKEFRAQVVIDYANSDVVAGTKERQAYEIRVIDEFKLEKMYLNSIDEWETYYQPYLGDYGPEKIRFVLSVLKNNFDSACWYSVYYYIYPDYVSFYGIPRYMPEVIAALETYNNNHPGAELKEHDGTPVTFPQP